MLIAAEVEDASAPFRDFADNWYAFDRGGPFLTAGSRPRWFNNPCAWGSRDQLNAMNFCSAAAREIINAAAADSAAFLQKRRAKEVSLRLMIDHAIPLVILRQRVFADVTLRSIPALRDYMRASYRRGVITSSEDASLNGLGLRSRMPADWDGVDPYARYRAASIL